MNIRSFVPAATLIAIASWASTASADLPSYHGGPVRSHPQINVILCGNVNPQVTMGIGNFIDVMMNNAYIDMLGLDYFGLGLTVGPIGRGTLRFTTQVPGTGQSSITLTEIGNYLQPWFVQQASPEAIFVVAMPPGVDIYDDIFNGGESCFDFCGVHVASGPTPFIVM